MRREHLMPTDDDILSDDLLLQIEDRLTRPYDKNWWEDACRPDCREDPLCASPYCRETRCSKDEWEAGEWEEDERWDAVDEWLTDVENELENDTDLEHDPDAGATTAEYAVLTLAAVAFAGVLAVVVRSGPVQSLLQGIIERALTP